MYQPILIPGERNAAVAQLAAEWKQETGLTNPEINREATSVCWKAWSTAKIPVRDFWRTTSSIIPNYASSFRYQRDGNTSTHRNKCRWLPPDGKALLILMLAQGTNLQTAASTTLQQLQVQVIGSRETTVNGLPALMVEGQQQQQNGGVLRTLSTFIQYNNTIYHLVGLSMAADYNAYANVFMNTMQGFRTLTDASKINRKPERIRLRTVSQAATLDQILRGYNTPANRLEELAILNGMLLTDRVAAGTMIKTIGE